MNPSKIVITGTIASGKSTLSKLLENLEYKVLSSDEINRQLLEEGNKNYEAIKSSGQFDQVFRGNELDKKKLARLIFQDKEKLKTLNKLTHKNVLNEINSIIAKLDQKVIFIEIPLYFQMEEKFEADEVWLVVADYDTQLQRLVERDSIDLEYAKAKIETQEDLLMMKRESDVIFDNSTSISKLMEQLKYVLKDKDLL